MLRVIKHKADIIKSDPPNVVQSVEQSQSISQTNPPVIEIYEVSLNIATEANDVMDMVITEGISIIETFIYRWKDGDLPKPSNVKYHVPKKLCIWYKRYLQKHYGLNVENMFYKNGKYIGWVINENKSDLSNQKKLGRQLRDIKMFPIFGNKNFKVDVDQLDMIDERLKFDVFEAFKNVIK